ncbi:E3 ubiquitin-protein ligase RNF4-like isoform X1 [Stegodyphus dumicola]|uniref:E3 ubiquitin-protein ligase RNF4-like isoform X1 n=1 Tax=Stegodyphus dumicola TaxID=202533 RepID=UPI0015AF32C7|nr:E3 ubiquitin-protein ligase RNF4-like isoform X1 [Stegodyphus dumicola]
MNRPTLRRSERLANRRTAVRHKDLQVPKRTHRRRAMNRTLFEGQLNQSTASDRQQGRSLAGQELRGGIRDVREQQRQDEQQPAEQQQSAEVAYVRQHTASAAQQQDRSIDGQQQRDEIPRIGEQTDSRNEQSDEVTIIGQQIADDNDVIYMYTVDHQNGRIVEIVDLAEENQQNTARNVRLTDQATEPSNAQDPSQSVVVIGEIPKKNDAHRPKHSEKPKPPKKRQRHSPDIRCPSCRRSYDNIQKRGQGLHSSRCGHLLCLPCFNKLPEPRRCVVCRMKIMDFCRIFL